MADERLIPRAVVAVPLALLALAGCPEDAVYEGAFDMPVDAAVLPPEVGGPFEEPIGYVANGIGGQITPLSLKQGLFLADDPIASFLRGAALPTGGARLLESVATWSPDEATVHVFAGDLAFEQLLRVPHVIGLEGDEPIEAQATVGEPVFIDLDGSGGAASLESLQVKTGFTTTETWTVAFDGHVWWVEGSRSGRQAETATPGFPYWADERRIGFTIEGDGTVGDRFEIPTDSGVVEYDVGGSPLELSIAPDQSVLAMIVHDRDLDAPVLRWFDPVADALIAGPELPAGAQPTRMAWAPDGSLFVADLAEDPETGAGFAWQVHPSTGEVVEHPLPFPTADVAPMFSDEDGTRLLYVHPFGSQEIWILDLDAGALVDVNTWRPGLQGMDLRSPVTGIEAMPVRYRFPETNEAGVQRWGRSVAVSLAAGRIAFVEEGTGCLVRDEFGPRTDFSFTSSALDYATSGISALGAYLEPNANDTRSVQVNPCAGVAAQETWVLLFDRNQQAWVVEGTLSGVQVGLAREDQRYVTDDGAVSFLVRSGHEATEDGARISFRVLDGILYADGDNDDDDRRDVEFDLPSDPVFFSYRVGPVDGGWTAVDERPFVLVAGRASDTVGRIEPQTGDVEIGWQ